LRAQGGPDCGAPTSVRCYTLRVLLVVTTAAIPNRSVFRAQEVCDIAQVQPYVLKSWEAEFPDLGVSKSASSPRIYRRADVERVLRLKHLLFVDGLTLAGARKRLSEEGVLPTEETVTDAAVAELIDDETRQHLRDVRRGLQWILGVLSGDGVTAEDRVLVASPRLVPRPARAKVPVRRPVPAKATARRGAKAKRR
jgi:DNA-binding transcriptional MerR regulator